MFLTPPDIISQTLLALPMWLLFEVGIFFSKLFLKRKEDFSKASEDRYQQNEAAAAASGGSATPTADEVEAEFDESTGDEALGDELSSPDKDKS